MTDLFDTSGFPARWNCGEWSTTHGWIHIISDILIFSAYFTIPAMLAYFIIRRKDLPFPRVFMLFVLFIASCGLTHLLEATIFWWPAYRLAGLLKVLTAAASWLTVLALIPIVPKALRLPGLARVNDELTEEIRQRKLAEEQLLAAGRALEQSNMDLEQFAYVASHDLQEPLRKIQAFSSILQEDSSALNAENQAHLQRIVASADRMRRLIDDLLTYSRLDASPASAKTIDLNTVMQDAVDEYSESIAELKATVTWADLPTVMGVPIHMHQLVSNLLGNALKFHSPDRPPVITVQAEKQENEWAIRVADNGIGFDAKQSPRIFEPFQRLHASKKIDGSGIGLSICERIVRQHGGRIEVESEMGSGATFIVYLPVASAHA